LTLQSKSAEPQSSGGHTFSEWILSGYFAYFMGSDVTHLQTAKFKFAIEVAMNTQRENKDIVVLFL
jgi:hypothetical protein